jgi:hypothetical protein
MAGDLAAALPSVARRDRRRRLNDVGRWSGRVAIAVSSTPSADAFNSGAD